MKTFWHVTVLLLILVNASSASSGEDVFSGCYSLARHAKPSLKIDKTEDTYFVAMGDKDGWKERVSLHPGVQQEIAQIFKKDSNRIKSSLVADDGPFALFHVQAGETYNGHKAESDYFTYIFIRGGSAYKKDCID